MTDLYKCDACGIVSKDCGCTISDIPNPKNGMFEFHVLSNRHLCLACTKKFLPKQLFEGD